MRKSWKSRLNHPPNDAPHHSVEDGFSSLQLRHLHPPAFGVRLQAEFGELYAFGSFPQGPGEGGVEGDVFQEQLPLDFEGVFSSRQDALEMQQE